MSIARSVPQTVRPRQPLSVRIAQHHGEMDDLPDKPPNPFPFLWENIQSLMGGRASIDAVQRKVLIGRGIIQRIHNGRTNIEASSLRSIANAFGIEAWQLLVPGLDPKNLPKLGEVKVISASILPSDITAAIANADAHGKRKVERLLRVELDLPADVDSGNAAAA